MKVPATALLGVALSLPIAGTAAGGEVRVGVVAGGTLSRLGSSSAATAGELLFKETIKFRGGFTAGGALEIGAGQWGTVRIEPRYVEKGSKFTLDVQAPRQPRQTISSSLKLGYIDVPIMLRTEFFKSKPAQFYMMSGIGPNFLASAKADGEDVKDELKSAELGIVSCFGVIRHTKGGTKLLADIRLSSSLTRIDKGTGKEGKTKGTSLQITFSVVPGKK